MRKKKNLKINKIITENKIQNSQETIDQLKNTEQEEKIISSSEAKNKFEDIQIKSLEGLIEICENKKELKIKYEIENNLRLVSFQNQKIEISFNSNLDKTFVKELSAKLLEWTSKRWIIAFSKKDGYPTLKQQKKDYLINLLEKENKSKLSDEIKKIFPDAELLNVEDRKDK